MNRHVPWHVIGALIGFMAMLIGCFIASWIVTDAQMDVAFDREERTRTRLACIEGNEAACDLYRVDYAD